MYSQCTLNLFLPEKRIYNHACNDDKLYAKDIIQNQIAPMNQLTFDESTLFLFVLRSGDWNIYGD